MTTFDVPVSKQQLESKPKPRTSPWPEVSDAEYSKFVHGAIISIDATLAEVERVAATPGDPNHQVFAGKIEKSRAKMKEVREACESENWDHPDSAILRDKYLSLRRSFVQGDN